MSLNKENKIIILTCLFFFLAKLFLAIIFSANKLVDLADQSTFRYWSQLLVNNGLEKFYTSAQFFPYPPLANYLLFFIGRLCVVIGVSFASPLFNLFIRLPAIFGDVLTALLLYIMARKIISFRVSYILLWFYLLQPAAIFITSVWGQLDGFMTFFLVLAFYLTVNKRINFGMVSMLCAFLIKPQALPIIVSLSVMALAVGGVKRFFPAVLLTVTLFFLLFYPFYPTDPFLGPFVYFAQTLRDFSPRFTASAFNFWYLLYGGWKDTFPVLLGISVRLWTRILFFAILILCSILAFFKKSINDKALAIALCGLAFFLFFTQVKERYLFSSIPFFGLAAFAGRNRIAIIITVVLSILFSINSIGFFVGWVWLGLWNSTFLSRLNLDKIAAAGFILIFCYYLYLLLELRKINAAEKKKK